MHFHPIQNNFGVCDFQMMARYSAERVVFLLASVACFFLGGLVKKWDMAQGKNDYICIGPGGVSRTCLTLWKRAFKNICQFLQK